MTPITDRLRVETIAAARTYFDKGRCSGHEQFNGRYCRDVAEPYRWCIHCAGFMLLELAVAALTPTPAPQEEMTEKDDLPRQSSPCPSSGTGSPRSPQPEGSAPLIERLQARLDTDHYLGCVNRGLVREAIAALRVGSSITTAMRESILREAAEAVNAEYLEDPTRESGDVAYQQAITDALDAIGRLVEQGRASDARPTRPEGSQATGSATKTLSSLTVPDARAEGPTTEPQTCAKCGATEDKGHEFGFRDHAFVAAPGAEDATLIERLRMRASTLEDAAFHFQTCRRCRADGEFGRETCIDGKLFAAFMRGEKTEQAGASAPAAGSPPTKLQQLKR